MLDKLKSISDRYDEINEKLSDPSIMSDLSQYKALMKENKNLAPIVEKYNEYKKAVRSSSGQRL